jgi:hypothetical protein
MAGLVTTVAGFFYYTFVSFIDTRPGTVVDGMIYQNTYLQNCSVLAVNLIQSVGSPVEAQVI